MGRCYLVVEGHGDGKAALNLITRLCLDLRLPPLHWAEPYRGKNLHQQRGIQKVCEYVRSKADAQAIMLLRDEDDGCPKDLAPIAAKWIRTMGLPFPGAIVLAHREFEAFFLPCISQLAGRKLQGSYGIERAGLVLGTTFSGNAEDIRGVKEWLSRHMPQGRSYKPTVDQLPLTRMIDLKVLRCSVPPLPCFGSLERALKFLAEQIQTGCRDTYPR
ncbi:MAG: DUF4276 family protein [Opitutaceae bacterium]|nr:DUF4276 family protein [Opitutaceae bacterium]